MAGKKLEGAESQRLEEDAQRRQTGNAGDPTSPSANGPRSAKITRPTATLGPISPRPRPQPRLSLGRGRPAGHHRPRVPAVLSPWPSGTSKDPILKERLFGLTDPAGQPRRGREGVLLLPRRHARPTPT